MKQIKLAATVLTLLAAILSLVPSVLAADIPEPKEYFYVLDQSGVLGSDTIDYIVSMNEQLCSATGAQIVVVTVDFTPDGNLERYAYNLFNEWDIGSGTENNGVLLLLSIGDDDYWCMQGKGLENTLTSGAIGNILEEYLEPDFAVQQYDAGVRRVFDALYDRVADIYDFSPVTTSQTTNPSDTLISPEYIESAQQNIPQPTAQRSRVSFGSIIITVIAVIFIVRLIGKGGGSGCLGCLLGWTMFGNNNRHHPPGGFGGPRGGFGGRGGPPPGRFGGSGRSSGGFGGSGRSSGGFGGSSGRGSHSGGGGSTRGGGAGRRH